MLIGIDPASAKTSPDKIRRRVQEMPPGGAVSNWAIIKSPTQSKPYANRRHLDESPAWEAGLSWVAF
jgi:hypothetical protein